MVPFQTDEGEANVIVEVYPALVNTGPTGSCAPRFAQLLPSDLHFGTDQYDAAVCTVLTLAYGNGSENGGLPALIGPAQDVDSRTLASEGWIFAVAPSWLRTVS